jgi:uncharacterized membrane protein
MLLKNVISSLELLFTKKKNEYSIIVILFLIFTLIFAVVSLHRFWQYSVWYYDFGIFFQAISSVSRLEAPVIDHLILTDKNILGDHFHPLIFIISPLLYFTKVAETLLVVQVLFVAFSGIVLYFVSKHLTKNNLVSLCFLIIYYSFIGLHNALITEFHEIALLTLPLSIFFYGMVKKSKLWFFVGLLGVLFAKETTFIIPLWFGLLLAIRNKGQWRKIGIITSVLSALYVFVVIKFAIPYFSGRDYLYYSDAVSEFSLFDNFYLKASTVFKTLLSFGFLPLLAPDALGPIIFNWWSRFQSAGPRHDLGMHYNAEIAPTLLFASLIAWQRIIGFIKKKFHYLAKLFLLLFAGFSLFFSVYLLKSPALLFFNPVFYQHTKNFEFLDNLMEAIPETGVVMAQHNLAGKLAYRKVYMLRNNYKDFSPDYIVIDFREGQEPNNFLGVRDFDLLLNKLATDPEYEVYYLAGEQIIYKKKNF